MVREIDARRIDSENCAMTTTLKKKIHVRLQSEIPTSFRTKLACDSLDIDIHKKSIHDLQIDKIEPNEDWTIGVILGASGSGKTTLAKHMFGEDCFQFQADLSRPVIDQLPTSLTYDECAALLSGIGLTSVVCWVRPMYTLSNGQRARAEAVLQMTHNADLTVIDEWTSVVDRQVAKVMSHALQKYARRNKKRVVLCSCHYDILEWVNPSWVIDCNEARFDNCDEKKNDKKNWNSKFDPSQRKRGNIFQNITI